MLLSKTEIEEMKSRYPGRLGEQQSGFYSATSPDEKPVAFNFMQARNDFMRLSEAYNVLLNSLQSLTPKNILCLMEQKKFLVLIDSSYVRDTQILPGDLFINEETCFSDIDSEWDDYEASMVLGEYTASCAEQAIMLAAESENINPGKLIAYQIVD